MDLGAYGSIFSVGKRLPFYFPYSCYQIYTTLVVHPGQEPVACYPVQFSKPWNQWLEKLQELWMNN
jgi:hypothetical protein